MTRIKISIFIVCLLIFTSVFSGIWINGKCKSLIELSQQTGELFSADKKSEAVEVTRQLETEWENFRTYAAVLIHNNKLSEIDRICARIKHLTENNSEELLSELSELQNMFDLLRNGEIPKINSIL